MRMGVLDLAFFKISDHFYLAKMIFHLGYFTFHLGYCHVTWLLVSFQLQVSGEHCIFSASAPQKSRKSSKISQVRNEPK